MPCKQRNQSTRWKNAHSTVFAFYADYMVYLGSKYWFIKSKATKLTCSKRAIKTYKNIWDIIFQTFIYCKFVFFYFIILLSWVKSRSDKISQQRLMINLKTISQI